MPNNDSKRKRKGERADGRILVTLTIGRNESGKVMRKYFYGRTRKEAERKRDEYKRLAEMGISANADKMRLNDWIEEWLRNYKQDMNPYYKCNFMTFINRLQAALGGRLIRSINEADLQAALFAVQGKSASYINKYHSTICQIFTRARRNKIILDNPAEDLIVPVGTKGTHRALEKWESEFILAHWQEHRAGLWAMIMLLCGLRRGEMIALDWSNVDMVAHQIRVCEAAVVDSNRMVVVHHTKTASGMRVLPICTPLYEALATVPAAERVGCVCKSANGMRLTKASFTGSWDRFNLCMTQLLNGEAPTHRGRKSKQEQERIAKAVASSSRKVFDVRAHDLRHTFATALYDAGVSVKAAQYYLGHADLHLTLDLYTHLSKERENVERSQLVGFLDSWKIGNDFGMNGMPKEP